MTMFKGTFTPPEFTQEDLEEIEGRDGYADELSVDDNRLAVVYVRHLCRHVRSQEPMNRNEWGRMREWARGFHDEAQQFKTDVFRLLRQVKLEDEKE